MITRFGGLFIEPDNRAQLHEFLIYDLDHVKVDGTAAGSRSRCVSHRHDRRSVFAHSFHLAVVVLLFLFRFPQQVQGGVEVIDNRF